MYLIFYPVFSIKFHMIRDPGLLSYFELMLSTLSQNQKLRIVRFTVLLFLTLFCLKDLWFLAPFCLLLNRKEIVLLFLIFSYIVVSYIFLYMLFLIQLFLIFSLRVLFKYVYTCKIWFASTSRRLTHIHKTKTD